MPGLKTGLPQIRFRDAEKDFPEPEYGRVFRLLRDITPAPTGRKLGRTRLPGKRTAPSISQTVTDATVKARSPRPCHINYGIDLYYGIWHFLCIGFPESHEQTVLCHRLHRGRKMMVKTDKRWVWAIALVPVLGGMVGFALSMIMSPSDMRFWKWRADIVALMGYCCLIQGCLAIWFLIRRFWRRCLIMGGLFAFLAFLTYLALLGSGPDIENIRTKAASVTGCQPSGLVCLGGRLSRESVVLFKPQNGFEPSENFTPIPADDRETYRSLEETLEWLKVSNVPGSRILAFRCRLEFDTLFAVHRAGEWWLLFWGNVVM